MIQKKTKKSKKNVQELNEQPEQAEAKEITVDLPKEAKIAAENLDSNKDSVKPKKDAKKDDVKVTILAESLKVEHLGKVIVEGELGGRCRPNGSTWTMNKARVEITLEKADATKWPSLFVVEA